MRIESVVLWWHLRARKALAAAHTIGHVQALHVHVMSTCIHTRQL